ncbi:MAG: hypothetical protein ACH350_00385 [Parachlamydiaceae bacterium]
MNVILPISELTTLMGSFWGIKYQPSDCELRRVILHLTHYILQVNDISTFTSDDHYQLESLLALRVWKKLNHLCKRIGDSPFASLNQYEISSFFLGDGLCVAIVTDHFSDFLKTRSLAHSFFSFNKPVKENPEDGVQFQSFHLKKEVLALKFSSLRFLQAVYKVGRLKIGQIVDHSEFISPKILMRYHLRVAKRIPSLKSKDIFFKIEELILQLSKDHHQNSALLLGISNKINTHALGVYMHSPFHFIDPMYGIGVTQNRNDLLLFLSHFLLEKYPSYQSFALLELQSTRRSHTYFLSKK